MAAPETPGNRAPGSDGPPLRYPHNLNSFQFVSQLISATPPYLFSMNTPFPGNFFSDLLRRMAPRTPGQPPDAALQQHLRAALLTKGTTPPHMPPLPPQLDLPHRPPHLYEDKGLKRSLFSGDSDSDLASSAKRPRIDDSVRDDRMSRPAEGLPAPLLMQPPFLHSPVPPPPPHPDVLSPWAAHASLLRPQMPLTSHLPPPALDPYRLLLDLRLAGQLRSFASPGNPKELPSLSHTMSVSNGSSLLPPLHFTRAGLSSSRLCSLSEDVVAPQQQQPSSSTNTLRANEDSRLSAFHPPGREVPETSDEEGAGGERRSHSSSSGCSNGSRDSVSTQYIFRHLTQIYRTIDGQREEKQPDSSSSNAEKNNGSSTPPPQNRADEERSRGLANSKECYDQESKTAKE